MKIVLMNCSIITNDGYFELNTISQEEAEKLCLNADSIVSAIGHESTAQIMSKLLPVEVCVNRIKYQQQPGEVALVFQLNGRPPEGKILSQKEIEEMGYKWKIMQMYDLHDTVLQKLK